MSTAGILVEHDVMCVCPLDYSGWGCEVPRPVTCILKLVFPDITDCLAASSVCIYHSIFAAGIFVE
jgi:hypothetical protein